MTPSDRFLRLLLGTHVEHRAAVRDGVLDELVRAVDELQRLLQVDDVNAVALGEDEPLHLRIPAPGLMPEVNAALQQLPHSDDRSHAGALPPAPPPRNAGRDRFGPSARTRLAAGSPRTDEVRSCRSPESGS